LAAALGAALLRLAAAFAVPDLLAAAATAWAIAFLIYLWLFAAMLVSPSLPRRG
ncbi:MAG TPA: NnrS family protein, partial [Rhodocyclaceae bacterium]|nr:NnrS family protein [Rhodocyclaceae bacterium]